MFYWTRDKLARKIGFRYLKAKKSSRFLSLITGISIGGVCIGVLTLVVTLSIMSGFEVELKSRLFNAETHVLIESEQGLFTPSSDLADRVRAASPNVVSVFPVLQAEVILRSGKKVSGGLVKGVGPEQIEWVKKHVVDWAPDDYIKGISEADKIFIGNEMSLDLGVIAGDKVTLVSPVESDGPFGAIPRVKQYTVEGIYKTNVPEQELHVAFASTSGVESFLKRAGVLSQIEIKLDSLDHAEGSASVIKKALGSELAVRSWHELNAHLFRSLKLERIAMFSILVFIIVVASFNIISTLTMMVMEKKRSLSILRAMGATKEQISAIFLWEGAAIGIVGISTGLVISLTICYLLKKYPLIELPEVYYDRTLPVIIDPVSIALIVGVAMTVVILGSVVPARKASECTPLEGIRESR